MASYYERSQSFYPEKRPEDIPLNVPENNNRDDHVFRSEKEPLEEDNQRATWGRKAEYMLSALGYCVGFGNVYRFSYICNRNGGGAFLIPFFFFLFAIGLPLYFLEVSLGQFRGRGLLACFDICPLFKGLGISVVILTFIVQCCQSVIFSWILIYLVNSFKDPLPWSLCGQEWNTDNCTSAKWREELRSGHNMSTSTDNSTLAGLGNEMSSEHNSTLKLVSLLNASRTSPTEEFWRHYVLEMSSGLGDLGGLPWHTALALAIGLFIAFMCLIKGIKSMGKVVYVTATLPYILIIVFIVRGATLPGALDGVIFYLKPDFSKLTKITTWTEACLQVLYSLGPAWGGLHVMSSYNKFHNNCLRDSVILTVCCEGTSVLAGFAIFTVLGHMSYTLGVPVDSFTRSGAGLAFVVYPEAISYMPLSQLWGVLFFLMLFTVGLDSAFVCAEVFLSAVMDKWPQITGRREVLFKLVGMVVFILCCMPFASRGGMYLFQLVDWYCAAVTPVVVAFLECIIVTYIYGHRQFRRDLSFMLGYTPPAIFVLLWGLVTPLILIGIFLFMLWTYQPPSLEDYKYTSLAQYFGWAIAVVSFVPTPIYCVYSLLTAKGTFCQRLKTRLRATSEWRPADPSLSEAYFNYKL